MKTLFNGITVFVCIFSFLSAAGLDRFELLRAENIGINSLEFFAFLLIVFIGLRGLLASRLTPTLFKLAGDVLAVIQGIYLSFVCAIIGWGLGLVGYAIYSLNVRDTALAVILLLLAILMFGAPLLWQRVIENQALEYIEFRIYKRRFVGRFRVACISFIAIGGWGFTQIL